jgi:4-amino-4-deoxy-L-arabinose transferase-like glycosyltransferase
MLPGGRRDGRPQNAAPQNAAPGFGGETLSQEAVRYLVAHHAGETWLVAVVGAMVAAPVVLETGQPVMAVGGYNGNDPAPTVDQLRQYVHDAKLRYVWTSGSSGIRAMGSESVDTQVVDESMGWVASHCAVVPPAEQAGESSTRLYDCAGAQ